MLTNWRPDCRAASMFRDGFAFRVARARNSGLFARGISAAFVRRRAFGYDDFEICAAPAKIEFHRASVSGGGIMAISVGAAAPDFTLKDQNQKEVKLSDFKGKKNVVIVFYPLDWSPVCTNEHACFVNDMKRFEQLDAQVLGLSVDSVWSHKAFAEKMGIHYPLLADFHPRGAVADKFGAYLPEKGITGRAIAVIDRAGKVAWYKNYDIPVVPDLKEVSEALSKIK
jgi:mycoredoxin-dependent peroxiredoxin